MKKPIIVNRIFTVYLTLLIGATSWAAPTATEAKSTPKLKAVTLDEIRISTDDGGMGGAHGGASSSWTLRSNDTMDSFESASTFDAVAGGDEGFAHVNGAMPEGSYANMLGYLQWTHLLDMKSSSLENATPDGSDGGVTISLKRNGKTKSVRLAYAAGGSTNSAIWTTFTLLNTLEAGIDWKNAQGLSLNTGVYISFASSAEGLPPFTSVTPPVVTVRDSKGKEVGKASLHSMAGADTLVLAPGTYKLQVPANAIALEGYVWRAVPETVVVSAGKMTPAKVALQKKPATP